MADMTAVANFLWRLAPQCSIELSLLRKASATPIGHNQKKTLDRLVMQCPLTCASSVIGPVGLIETFSVRRKRGRASYAFNLVFWSAIFGAFLWAILHFIPPYQAGTIRLVIVFWCLLIMALWSTLSIQRIADLGRSYEWVTLLWFPVANLFLLVMLLFVPGKKVPASPSRKA